MNIEEIVFTSARSETTHTDWEKPEQADLQDLEESPSQPTSSGQLSSPGSPENVTTTGPPESCTNGSLGNLITTRSGRVVEIFPVHIILNEIWYSIYTILAVIVATNSRTQDTYCWNAHSSSPLDNRQ
ncbi:hypothetical protein LAZ67_3005197 [Cordylochernes scorpioides]|uniref:Uncharacterized protein n=1 Tax=Cordylochernes scorpioides TaxID=51811 RepID=A0ABY6KA46_9ARAC|nr:hypothetical protein LAZ67_3005197 [Cordylochernes scorpioides]